MRNRRTGAPFPLISSASLRTMITAAKALGNVVSVSALLLSRTHRGAAQLRLHVLTSGAHVLCRGRIGDRHHHALRVALASAPGLAYIRSSCVIGPSTRGVQGAGFLLLGLKTFPTRPRRWQSRLLAKNILTGTSGSDTSCSCCRRIILNRGHVDQLRRSLAKYPHEKRFLNLGRFQPPRAGFWICSLPRPGLAR